MVAPITGPYMTALQRSKPRALGPGPLDDRTSEAASTWPNDATVYVAREKDGNVIAFAETPLRRDYVNGCNSSPVGFLEGIYVEAPYRGRGFARLLNKALEEWAAGLGCTEFASDVWLQNEAGQKAHEALGFEETDRVVFYAKRLARQ